MHTTLGFLHWSVKPQPRGSQYQCNAQRFAVHVQSGGGVITFPEMSAGTACLNSFVKPLRERQLDMNCFQRLGG